MVYKVHFISGSALNRTDILTVITVAIRMLPPPIRVPLSYSPPRGLKLFERDAQLPGGRQRSRSTDSLGWNAVLGLVAGLACTIPTSHALKIDRVALRLVLTHASAPEFVSRKVNLGATPGNSVRERRSRNNCAASSDQRGVRRDVRRNAFCKGGRTASPSVASSSAMLELARGSLS